MTVSELLDAFGSWAWARHHNALSWYVRPLFLIPLAWFAYRRSGWGVAATLMALATSMFWFPAPTVVDPQVAEFLDFERRWLTGGWSAGKVGQTLLVPLLMGVYVLAFWRRSLAWGLALLNVMAVAKLLWGILAGDGAGWAMTVPALVGLALGDVVLVAAWRRLRAHRGAPAGASDLVRFRAEHPVRRRTVDGVEWSYITGGSGDRTVLYLPGGTGRAEAAFGSLRQLEGDQRVIAVDYPDVASIDALADGLVGVLDAESVEQADVWGTSFGGMVAQVLVRRAPGRVGSMVLSNTAVPDPVRAARADRLMRVTAALPAWMASRLFAVTAGRQLRSLPPAQRDLWRWYLRQLPAADGGPRLARLSRLAADFYRRHFDPDDLAAWPGRVLLLSATEDGLYGGMHARLSRLYRGADEVLVPGGHAATLSRQDDYVNAVEEFLRLSTTAGRVR